MSLIHKDLNNTTELQANVLTAGAIKKALPACMLYALVTSLTFMVDTMVAGAFLDGDAVAATALGLPPIGLMLSCAAMIMQGGFLKMIISMGRNDMQDYNRIFSLALVFLLAVDFVFLALCLFKTDTMLILGGAGSASPAARAMSNLYVRTACLEIIFFSLGCILQLVLATYGYLTSYMMASLICVVVNTGMSVLLVNVLPQDIKIAGIGIASSIGSFCMMIAAIGMLRRRKIRLVFKIQPVNKANLLDCLDMLRRGLPASMDNMLDSISLSIVNRIILAAFAANGTSVLALVTIIKTVFKVLRIIPRGVYFASEPLIGILGGGKDNEGIKKAFKTDIRLGLVCAACAGVLTIILKNPILSFYNMEGNADANTGIILIAISAMILVFPFSLNAVYEPTGHLLRSLAVAAIPDSLIYPLLLPVAIRCFGITGIWLAMGYNFLIFIVIYYLLLVLRYRRFPVSLDHLLALKKEDGRVTHMDVSVPAEAKDVTFISEKLQGFLLENGVSSRLAYKAALCTDEIAADYIEHRKNSQKAVKKAYMDIKVFREADSIKIIVRNYDEPYNPLVFQKEEDSVSKIGITMVQKISREILYSYAYHLNIVTIVMGE